MTHFPKYFAWYHQDFHEIHPPQETELLVADSWRVTNGSSWGLEDHVQRFFTGLAAQSPRGRQFHDIDPALFAHALGQKLWQVSQDDPNLELFPRISVEPYEDAWRIVLLVRPAPEPRLTTSLWIPEYTDPRTRPKVKGPDIGLMRELVAEVASDDVVLHDGTNVRETTTGGLLVWDGPDELVVCRAAQQLASISVQRIVRHARSHDIAVTTRSVTLQEIATGEYPVWFANTLHGISPVTTISSATGQRPVVDHPNVAQWQASWWQRFAL